MTIPNRPRLADLLQMPLGEIAALSGETLALLQEEADAALRHAKAAKDLLDGALDRKYGPLATEYRRQDGKDTGTVRFDDGAVTVVADLPKKVEWDQEQLAATVERIRASGDDPAEYVDLAFKVSERKYGAWPAHIRAAFESARTVKTGKPTFSLKPITP
ncbi:hypothetical protein [Paramagnetospirillum magneticum]|uniref:Uncharacterized protein n=1 Tax=Paramagnetospirillum magneticum (strain ATCC 700264 / AMB-1) TaxID=342108 RepID=Q2W874_PARM1|nr:hypothetical protein [Paramagnetospirillum magneticum]BAE49951.1 hypothetical protein amb1147 [Paramagnetospirillum magneticum AMB-1]